MIVRAIFLAALVIGFFQVNNSISKRQRLADQYFVTTGDYSIMIQNLLQHATAKKVCCAPFSLSFRFSSSGSFSIVRGSIPMCIQYSFPINLTTILIFSQALSKHMTKFFLYLSTLRPLLISLTVLCVCTFR